MREAMKQQKEWQDKYGDFKVSFNVSYRQFLVKEFVDELLITAQKLGVKTNNIILELTEVMIMKKQTLIQQYLKVTTMKIMMVMLLLT